MDDVTQTVQYTPEPKDPLGIVGKTIEGRFIITEYVASGGMGEFYKGHPVELENIEVGIKFYKEEHYEGRFKEEALRMQQFKHPNIVGIREYLPKSGAMIVDFINGRSCSDILAEDTHRKYGLDDKLYFRVALAMTSALRTVHVQGVFHRDIKPGNILIDKTGVPILIDFGISKVITGPAVTSTPGFMGTIGYIAPERWPKRNTGPGAGESVYNPQLSDIFELGTTLFELLTGNLPYNRAAAPRGAWDAQYPKEFSKELEIVLRKATAIDPLQRYQSMGEFHNALLEVKTINAKSSFSIWKIAAAVALVGLGLGFYFVDPLHLFDKSEVVVTTPPDATVVKDKKSVAEEQVAKSNVKINPVALQSVTARKTVSFLVTTSRSDTNTSLTMQKAPASAIFSPRSSGSGEFSWTPRDNQVGANEVTFLALDGQRPVDSITVTVNVKKRTVTEPKEDTPPSMPTALALDSFTSNSVNLSWARVDRKDESVIVQRRSPKSSQYLSIETLDADATSFTDTNLEPSKTYRYRLIAVSPRGQSQPSKSISVTTKTELYTLELKAPGARIKIGDSDFKPDKNAISLKPGKTTITVIYPGLPIFTKKIDIEANQSLDITEDDIRAAKESAKLRYQFESGFDPNKDSGVYTFVLNSRASRITTWDPVEILAGDYSLEIMGASNVDSVLYSWKSDSTMLIPNSNTFELKIQPGLGTFKLHLRR